MPDKKNNKRQISILMVCDNEVLKTKRMKKRTLNILIGLFFIFPILAGLGLWCGIEFYTENVNLNKKLYTLEQERNVYMAKAERLKNLEKILIKEEEVQKAIVANQIKESYENIEEHEETIKNVDEQDIHVDYPDVNKGIITVENVKVQLSANEKLRINLDLRNVNTENLVTGSIFCKIITVNEKTYPLQLFPKNAEKFKILRWKKSVFFAEIPKDIDISKAEIIIEVKNLTNDLLFRHIYRVGS